MNKEKRELPESDNTKDASNGADIHSAVMQTDDSANEKMLNTKKVRQRIEAEAKTAADKGGSPLNCALLDFAIIKPYIQLLNIVVYAGVAAFLSFTLGNPFFGFVAGLLLALLYLGYPFAVDGKYETRAIFSKLKLSPNNIVAGRYLFSVGFCLVAALGSAAISFIGLHFSRADYPIGFSGEVLGLLIILTFVLLSAVMVQLAFYYLKGFVAARFVGALPLAVGLAMMGGLMLIADDGNIVTGLNTVLSFVATNIWTIPASIGIYLVFAVLSYTISLKAYTKN